MKGGEYTSLHAYIPTVKEKSVINRKINRRVAINCNPSVYTESPIQMEH